MLSNPDLRPTTPDQRTWSTWHIAALWIGMAVCITTYTIAAGMIGQGMNWWQATLTVALGNAGIPVFAGRAVGGSTVINSGTCYRLSGRVFTRWRSRYGLGELSSASMDSYYSEVEEMLGVAPAERHDGPHQVGEVPEVADAVEVGLVLLDPLQQPE